MATPIQQNLEAKNAEYASSFTKGHLALPPAKKYLVCMYSMAYNGIMLGDLLIIDFQ